MADQKIDAIIRQIAKKNRTTPERVRQEIQLAMDAAMASSDPAVQARWAQVPRRGEKPTLEEFIGYMASLFPKSFS